MGGNKMIYLIVLFRLLGLIALAWTNWLASLFGFVILIVFQGKNSKALVKNDKLWILASFIAYAMAVIGIWYFPLIDETLSHVFAIVAIITMLLNYLIIFFQRPYKS
jgi:hypothetical protein